MKHKIRIRSFSECAPIVKATVYYVNNHNYNILGITDSKGLIYFESTDVVNDTLIVIKHINYCTKELSFKEINDEVRLLENKLVGYQDRIDYDPNSIVNVYIHSNCKFSAKLMRYGLERTCILDLGIHQPCIQQVPNESIVEKGLTWKKTIKYIVPSKIKSGIYSLYIENEIGEKFAIPMIVNAANSEMNCELLVLASNTTWQSYNIWGGRSRYRNLENVEEKVISKNTGLKNLIRKIISFLIPLSIKKYIAESKYFREPSLPWKFKSLSIKRPMTNCGLEEFTPFKPFTNHLAAGEWRLLAWLERENIDYALISCTKLHFNKHILNRRKALVLSTHCEYWTKEMYENVLEAHKNKKLWIINASGNSIYREIEFVDESSTRCKSLSFSESCSDETELLGVRFTRFDYGTCDSFKILKPNHWAFNDLPINNKYNNFGNLSLNQNTRKITNNYDPGRPGDENGLIGNGMSGWETDKLSSTASNEFKLIAKGNNVRGGADMVVREPRQTRGGVFSASSVTFTGGLLIDYLSSQIMKNVIEKSLSENT